MMWILSIVIVVAMMYRFKGVIVLLWIYCYSSLFIKDAGTIFIPIVLERRLLFIPIQKQKNRFYLMRKHNIYHEERAVEFLSRYKVKINSSKTVQVFDLASFEEKNIALADL